MKATLTHIRRSSSPQPVSFLSELYFYVSILLLLPSEGTMIVVSIRFHLAILFVRDNILLLNL